MNLTLDSAWSRRSVISNLNSRLSAWLVKIVNDTMNVLLLYWHKRHIQSYAILSCAVKIELQSLKYFFEHTKIDRILFVSKIICENNKLELNFSLPRRHLVITSYHMNHDKKGPINDAFFNQCMFFQLKNLPKSSILRLFVISFGKSSLGFFNLLIF